MTRKKSKFTVEKRNVLNEIIAREFTLQELRLFSIYLGRINAREPSTRIVRIPIKWFYKIMDIKPLRIEYLENITRNLLTKVVAVPRPTGGYNQFQLFKECVTGKDNYGQWYFEIDAHDRALPLMFRYRKDYFKYELWNVIGLDSVNQFRMYEILKEFEYKTERVINVDELRVLLGIKEEEYTKYSDFRRRVLDACQQALKEKTDISFTYKPHARGGKGGKIQSLLFTITKNEEYKSKINLEDFIDLKVIEDIKQEPQPEIDVSALDFISEALTDKDKASIMKAADYDVSVVQTVYEIARTQGNIGSLTAWMITMIKRYKNGEVGVWQRFV